MNYPGYQMPLSQGRQGIQQIMVIEPYVVETLRKIIGRSVVVETVRGNLQGILADVKPDHIIVKSYDSDTEFYVRIQEIVHVMPV